MAIAYCSACGQNVYLTQKEQDSCPVCSAGLAETEDTIKVRLATS
jgi:RNA polymerase subunit RPABC4/transcription elongation factor Spt4